MSNSRFSVLIKETNNKNVFIKKDKRKKTDETHTQEKKSKSENINRKTENSSKEENNYKKEKNILANENFPQLLTNVKNAKPNEKITEKKEINFIDKIKCEKKEILNQKNNINEYNDDIEPGWVEISFNPKTREFSRRYNLRYVQKNDTTTYNNNNENKALNALIKTHKKRTQEYIDMWGYEEWEKMFRFPDYDYEYFDKLDELYDKNMNNSNETEPEDSDYYSD
jgi:hypothetical protein